MSAAGSNDVRRSEKLRPLLGATVFAARSNRVRSNGVRRLEQPASATGSKAHLPPPTYAAYSMQPAGEPGYGTHGRGYGGQRWFPDGRSLLQCPGLRRRPRARRTTPCRRQGPRLTRANSGRRDCLSEATRWRSSGRWEVDEAEESREEEAGGGGIGEVLSLYTVSWRLFITEPQP
jgi:hypothetical protein